MTATELAGRAGPAVVAGSGTTTAAGSTGAHPTGRDLLADRVGWTVTSVFVVLGGLQAWSGSVTVPGANAVSVVLVLTGLVSVWRIWSAAGPVSRRQQALIMAGIVAGVSVFAAGIWLSTPAYGTDAVAFDQYAARLVLHGLNPYAHSMAPSFQLFHVPAVFHSYQVDGTAVTSLSYPAGSFLVYLPLLALHWSIQTANIVDLLFWFATGVLAWLLLPRKAAWSAGVFMASFFFLSYVIGGLTDTLYLPFVLLAVFRWDRFADPGERSWVRWAGPLALGLACSIKQTPWFLAPYLLAGVYFETRGRGGRPVRAAARYGLTVAAVFLAVNAPFLIAAPGAWLRGILVPLRAHMIPDGQGLVDLTIFNHLGGGALSLYSAAGAVCMMASLVAFTVFYPRLKRAWLPIVALTFFLPTRSFGSYLIMLLPAVAMAGLTVRPAVETGVHRRVGTTLVAVLAMATAALAALAVFTPPPLSVRIVSTRSTGEQQTIDAMQVVVTNRTGQVQQPRFTINSSDHVTTFWYAFHQTTGSYQVRLAPHARTTIELRAPNTASMPPVDAPMFLEAFTTGPDTLSTSPVYQVSPLGTQLIPDAIDVPVPVGKVITFTVQLQNRLGAPVRRAGVPVTLGQIIYAQNGFLPGDSSINGWPEGHSPVSTLTNAAGAAVFHVKGVQVQGDPVTYEALLGGPGSVPHGYSNQVAVQFVPGAR